MTTITSPTAERTWSDAATAWDAALTAAGQHPNLAASREGSAHLATIAGHLDAGPWDVSPDDLARALTRIGPDGRRASVSLSLHRFYAWATGAGHLRRSPLQDTTLGAWAHAVDQFAEHLDRLDHPRASTRADYCRRTFTYGRQLPAGPWDLTPAMIAADLETRNWSLHTRKATLVALRRFYAWGVRSGRVQRSPLVGIPDGTPHRPGPLKQEPTDAWDHNIRDFLTTMRAAGRRAGTVNLRRVHLTNLSQTFAHPWTVTTDDLALWLSNSDWAPETRRNARGTVRIFYRWAVLTERLDRDPAVPLLPVKLPRALPRPAPDEAVLAGFERADHRTRLAIELGMYAGLRISEVVALAWSDVLPDSLRVTGKGGDQRLVPLHGTLARSLSAERSRVMTAGAQSQWIFPSQAGGHLAPQSLGRFVSAALPDNWTHHTLRHRFATQAYESDRDLRAVQELLGHVRPETTARYAAVPKDALTSAVAGVGLILDRHLNPSGR